MPPRTVKRGAAAAATRRTSRVTRGTLKPQNQPQESIQEPAKVEEAPVSDDAELKEAYEKPFHGENSSPQEKPANNDKGDLASQAKSIADGIPPTKTGINKYYVEVVKRFLKDVKKEQFQLDSSGTFIIAEEDNVKDSVDEYGKEERLDLDINEPEYEPEEFGGEYYYEKELEEDDVHPLEDEEDEDLEEEKEAGDGGDFVEDEFANSQGEADSEADEHAGEEVGHVETVDVEEEYHHDVVRERRKRKEFEVFVGGLDKDATEDDLRKVFSQVGEVTEVRLMMNPQTKKNKGFAFLRFASVEQAKRAVTELKNPVIKGKQCGVTPSQDSDTLFVGNISKSWTKEALREKLKHYGVENVDDITLVEDSNNRGMNRGFAFLEFSSRSDAMDAFKLLQRRDVQFGVDRPAKVSFADSFIDPGDEIMAQVKTIFVDGLPPVWDEARVSSLLKEYGRIEKIELARDMPSAKRKDFGFVTFDTHDAAVTCAKSINNAELGEGDDKAKVRARLSRPLQRGKGKRISRIEYRPGHSSSRIARSPWARPAPRGVVSRSLRGVGTRVPIPSTRRFAGVRDRRPIVPIPARARPLPPPSRSFDRRPPVPSYPKSSLKRDYDRFDDLPPPRSRAATDYNPRVAPVRRPPYRDEYISRASGYPEVPRGASGSGARRLYVDDPYGQRFERPPSYREGRTRDYDSISGSKRPYSALDDVPPRYFDMDVRHSRPRLEYDFGGAPSAYGDAYGDRLGRPSFGYESSRTSISGHDSHGLYSGRQGMGYGGGSFGGGNAGRMYSSYGGDYISRGRDAGSGSYSSVYSSRGMGGGTYMGGGARSYY